MSIPVNLINSRNSLLLTQQKLSKSVDSRTKRAKRIYAKIGGADQDRTGGLMLAKHALSQLSYCPVLFTVVAQEIALSQPRYCFQYACGIPPAIN